MPPFSILYLYLNKAITYTNCAEIFFCHLLWSRHPVYGIKSTKKKLVRQKLCRGKHNIRLSRVNLSKVSLFEIGMFIVNTSGQINKSFLVSIAYCWWYSIQVDNSDTSYKFNNYFSTVWSCYYFEMDFI